MSLRIEQYALLSDLSSCALVGIDGSIDWLTFPRFDSGASFAALLGDAGDNGRWLIAPEGPVDRVERAYRGNSLVLDTMFHTPTGVVRVTDCMPPHLMCHAVARRVECLSGYVKMHMHMTIRFDYGGLVPWVRRVPGGVEAIGGPEALRLATPIPVHGHDLSTVANFTVHKGERVPFTLSWYPSIDDRHQPVDAATAIAESEAWWNAWVDTHCTYQGDYAEEVIRSAIVLKGLTLADTGGLIAAATTSLPEEIGGERNWDYRYVWLRDATFSLMALQNAGFSDEALAWRNWLLRAVAGDAAELQIMYGPAGERRLTETELEWLGGYEGSRPVRVGNGAAGQFQLDVYGEVLDALYQSAVEGQPFDADAWSLQRNLVEYVAEHWREPDDGIWEVRGGRRHFTHSKVMAWVAVDRAIATAEHFGLDRIASTLDRHPHPVDLSTWKALAADIRADVLANGVNEDGAFVQSYGSSEFDASLLLVPLVGFLPADDPHVAATVAAIEKHLISDGFVRRYRPTGTDGLSGSEGTFLMCSFWLVDNYALMGRLDEATELFERLVALRNDVGLLAEEYDPAGNRMLGNFPQAFSHVSLINSAGNIHGARLRARDEHGSGFVSVTTKRRSHCD